LHLINTAGLFNSPSPRTFRALRRLQSAHTLGSKAAPPNPAPSVPQQRVREQQRNPSPTRSREASNASSSTAATFVTAATTSKSPQRGRSNSDAAVIQQRNAMPPSKRASLAKSSPAADGLSLDRLLRDGPPNGDLNESVESLRLKVIRYGVKSDGDG